jgi:predicted nuclease with TOPRIM domain
MTGYELLKNELISRGYHVSKINANEEFIKSIITILSDETVRNDIDLAAEEHKKALKAREEAENYYFSANKRMYEINERQRELDEQERLLDEKTREINQKYEALKETETAEARDKIRLYTMFMSDLPRYTDSDVKSVIYSMGAILSGQAVQFSSDSKGVKNHE